MCLTETETQHNPHARAPTLKLSCQDKTLPSHNTVIERAGFLSIYNLLKQKCSDTSYKWTAVKYPGTRRAGLGKADPQLRYKDRCKSDLRNLATNLGMWEASERLCVRRAVQKILLSLK